MFIALKENKCILYKCIILYGNVYKLLIHCIYIYIYIYIYTLQVCRSTNGIIIHYTR